MHSFLLETLGGFDDFLLYFLSSLAFLALFCRTYSWFTPYNEFRLIREGKIAPAISLGGAMIGFVLPLASAISHSVSFIDMVIWAALAMAVQFAVFSIVRVIFKNLVKEIENDHRAAATMLASFSIAIGILNAVSMTY